MADSVHLRLTLLLRDLHLEGDRDLVIPVKTERDVEVRFRRPDAAELATDGAEVTVGDTICALTGAWHVGPANRRAFEKLAREGGGELTELVVVFGVMRAATGMPAWDALPESIQSLLDGATAELGNVGHRTVRLMRWMLTLRGEHNPFRFWSLSWSPDGANWQLLPRRVPLRPATFARTLRPSDALETMIAKALAEGREEPVGHELLREAIHQVEENPRSALIVGMAAAEIGFKDFVGRRLPQAAWFVTESPTPPLLTMLTQFLPELLRLVDAIPGLQFVEGRDKKRDYLDPVLRDLNHGVSMRNALVHKPGPPPDPEKVKPVLAAVRDLLGMLDYYSGAGQLGAVNIRGPVHAVWLRPYTPKPPGG